MARSLRTTRSFDRDFKRLPKTIREQAVGKLALFIENAAHPSLRVKRMQGSDIWEMSITMNYRLTFGIEKDHVILRRIGTHDILRQP